ncbi:hypothetical protein BamMEX5DRAFT_6914 [Burkholderia ambifaria MEX-5]|uniref:Uncharacterized protein n=1 Tax=Burkholderia ambifaria MEX-5 TaxID=396597 RepID=B1TGJ8_9BURK|nr:hypothetical protein BamMEX5DRAFT_6914 [Burkholderia ambifaria MEX-5]
MTPMPQHRVGHAFDMRHRHRVGVLQRRERARGAQHHEVGAQAVDGRVDAQRAHACVNRIVEIQRRQPGPRRVNPVAEFALCACMTRTKRVRIEIERKARLHDPFALRGVEAVLKLDHQPEAVEQLRAQFAFLGIHRADQHEARIVRVRHAIALDHVHAARGDVEQRIDEAVGEQVHFVDIQHAAMRAGEQAGPEPHAVGGERMGEIERAGDLLVARRQRQRDEFAFGQQFRQRARGGRFRGAARPADEHATERRVDRGEQQRLL